MKAEEQRNASRGLMKQNASGGLRRLAEDTSENEKKAGKIIWDCHQCALIQA